MAHAGVWPVARSNWLLYGQHRSVTPMHDGLAINAGENMAESNPRAAREFEKQRRQSLRKGLAGIPEPQASGTL